MKNKNILYGLVAFNILLSVFTASIFIFGVVSTFRDGPQGRYPLPFNDYAIGAGIVIFSTCLFGCHALHKKSKFLLLMYVGILIVSFTFQVIIGIMGLIKIQDEKLLYKEIYDDLKAIFENWDINEIDRIQRSKKCCGTYGPEYYYRTIERTIVNQGNQVFPRSCCKPNNAKPKPCVIPDYQEGCAKKVLELFKTNVKWVGGFAIGLGLTQLICGLLTLNIRKYLMGEDVSKV